MKNWLKDFLGRMSDTEMACWWFDVMNTTEEQLVAEYGSEKAKDISEYLELN